MLKELVSIDSLKSKINENNSYTNFAEKIILNEKNNKISIIAEIKKASPSAGIIITDYNPLNIAEVYNNKAQCGACHALKAAGTSSNIGPNLDQLKPKEDQIIEVVINGIGVVNAVWKNMENSEYIPVDLRIYDKDSDGKLFGRSNPQPFEKVEK